MRVGVIFVLVCVGVVSASAGTLQPPIDIGGAATRGPANVGYNVSPPNLSEVDGGFVAVWADDRTSALTPSIVLARLDSDGVALDPNATVLSGGFGSQRDPAVGCLGSSCLVTWSRGFSLIGVAFNAATGVVGPQLVLTTSPLPSDPSVGTDGVGFVLAYNDSGQVLKVRLNLSGAALEAPVQVSTGGVSGLVTVYQAESGALIAWAADLGSGNRMLVRFTSSAGALGPAHDLGAGGFIARPALAYDPGSATSAVSWVEGINVRLARIGPGEVVIDAPAKLVFANQPDFGSPSLAFGSGLLWVVYRDDVNHLWGTTMNNAGLIAPAQIIRAPLHYRGSALFSAMGLGMNGPVLLWNEGQYDTVTPRASRLLPGPELATPVTLPVDSTAPAQIDSTGVWAGDHFVVTWAEQTSSVRQVKARILDAVGSPITPTAATLNSESQAQRTIFQAATGTVGLSWVDPDFGPLWLAPLDGTGQLGPAQQLGQSMSYFEGAAQSASVGNVTLLVWSDYINSMNEVRGARWFLDGGVSSPGMGAVIAGGTTVDALSPALTASATTHLMAWLELGKPDQIQVSRLDAALVPLDSPALALSAPGLKVPPKMASDGSGFLVVWSPQSLLASDEVYGQLVSAAMTAVGGPFVIVSAADNDATDRGKATPKVVFDGRNYQVSWLADRADGGSLVRWRTVTPAGMVQSGGTWASSTKAVGDFAVIAGTSGRFGVSWAEYHPTLGSRRTQFRVFADVDEGHPCAGNSECRLGVCAASGFCCASGTCPVDAGLGADAGAVDSGTSGVDAGGGSGDGGSLAADAGGAGADSGVTTGGVDAGSGREAKYLVSCGCADVPGVAWWALGVLVMRLRRRRYR